MLPVLPVYPPTLRARFADESLYVWAETNTGNTGNTGDLMSDDSTPKPENRPQAGGSRWVKGISGNPGGRRKLSGEDREAMDLARKYGPRAVRRLAKLMHSSNERVAVAAAMALLDRGYGKAAQAITGPGGAPLVNITMNSGHAIVDAAEAARIYAEILGNPSRDLSGITFGQPAALPSPPQASEEPRPQPIAPEPVSTVAESAAVERRVRAVPVDHSEWERLAND